MNNKSILMPHSCQKVGWSLLILSVLVELVKVLFVHDIDVAWYFAKAAHITLIIALFLICLSKEKVEDEMISAYRLRAIGITAYVFFVIILVLSIVLEVKPGESSYLSELFLIVLPIVLFVLYYSLFKGMLLKSQKQ